MHTKERSPRDRSFKHKLKCLYWIIKTCCGSFGVGETLVNNATCTPQSPASMNVVVSACEIYAVGQVDTSNYGDLGENANLILKQGINLSSTILAITAPSTSGYSQNYLIEFGFSESDGDSTVLAYYNASNPSSPWSGPNNTGTPNNVQRQDRVSIIAKAGIAAPTGTQTTPLPDSGYVGGFVVTVAQGQTSITSSSISNYLSNNPNFINENLTQKISQATADTRYGQIGAIQNNQYGIGVDTGSANTYVATLSPAITSYTKGLKVSIVIANTNTGASTLNLNGVGAVAIKLPNITALIGGELIANMMANFEYDGTYFQLTNSNAVVRNVKYQYITSSGTYTPSAGIIEAEVEIVGGGGGSGYINGGGGLYLASGGGGAGGYAKKKFTAAQIGASQTVTIGAGGAGGTSGPQVGGNGGASSFGVLISATGGAGGSPGPNATNSTAQGGIGGSGSGGDINLNGDAGGYGLAGAGVGAGQALLGYGGRSMLSSNTQTGAGNNYGGGAAGVASLVGAATNGNAGASGICIVKEYCSV